VDAFVAPWFPFTRVKRNSGGEKGGSSSYVVGDPLAGMLPDEIGEMVQGFYVKLEEDLRASGGKKREREASGDGEDEEKEGKEEMILEVLASVERAICGSFFDR
jgi:hypothetical protein